MIERKQRSCNLDVIRIFAFLCVVSVHFFLNTNFNSQMIGRKLMLIPVAARSFFLICVPLFLLLSGYLMKNKTFSKSYYLKLFQTLGIYVLASIACAVYAFLSNRESFSFRDAAAGVLSFRTAPYSW